MLKKLLIILSVTILVGFGLAISANSVYADMILPLPEVPFQYKDFIQTRTSQFVGILLFASLNLLIDFFLLCIAYVIIKSGRFIKSWKFAGYLLLINIWGYLVDSIYYKGMIMVDYKSAFYSNVKLRLFISSTTFIVTFLTLALFNYFLARKLFKLQMKQAIFVGVWITILTSPFINIYHFFCSMNLIKLINPFF